MVRRRKRRLLLLLLLAIPVLALPLVRGHRDPGSAAQVIVAELGSIEERADGSGTLEGIQRVEISALSAGTVESLFVAEGDTVVTGQVLLRLDATQADAGLDQAGAQVRTASIALDRARREEERMRALHEAGLASEEEWTAAGETVRLGMAELDRCVASRAVALEDLDNTVCTSPIDGVVTALNVEEGETAVTGTMNNAGTVLLTVEDMSGFRVRVTMVESEIVEVREGMPAEIVLDALPDDAFAGVVERVGLSATNDAGGEAAAEYEVLIRLDSPDPRMRSGMSASVEVLTARADSVVTVPIQCIVSRRLPGSADAVDAVLAIHGGAVRVVPVETGISGVMDISVTGIQPGDTLVSGPTDLLRTLQDGDLPGTSGSGGGGEVEHGDPQGSGPGPGFMPPGR